jgi:hypothetical protein
VNNIQAAYPVYSQVGRPSIAPERVLKSKTDPESLSAKKGAGKEAKLCYGAHALIHAHFSPRQAPCFILSPLLPGQILYPQQTLFS